jgi:hypothetical protein
MTTAQRDAIASPATGLMVYNTTTQAFNFYNGTAWTAIGADHLGNHTATENLQLGNHWLSSDGGNEGVKIDATGQVMVGKGVQHNARFQVSNMINSFENIVTADAKAYVLDNTNPSNLSPNNLIDNNSSTVWATLIFPNWIMIDLGQGKARRLTHYTIRHYFSGQYNTFFAPKDWTFEGSNDSLNWTILDTKSNYAFASHTDTFRINNTNAFRYYRLNVTASNSPANVTAALRIYELGLVDTTARQSNLMTVSDAGAIRFGDAYTFPTTDGTSGQSLITNGSGQLSWSQPSLLADANNDTKIQVEANPNDDMIRFTVKNFEAMRLIRANPSNAFSSISKLEFHNNSGNIFIGYGTATNLAYNFVNSGINNTIIGENAGSSLTTGTNNTVLGYQSGKNNTVGHSNVYLGYKAGESNITGAQNIFIGNQAGQNETGSNKLYIDNTNTATPLIWGDFGTNNIHINGALKVNGGFNINNAYSFPTADGSNGQILKTDGNGTLTWQNETPQVLNRIFDADNDTKVQVEKIADEDIIRFDIAGNERMTIKNNAVDILGSVKFNNAYSFPTADGSNGQVLKTNGSGVLSWQPLEMLTLFDTDNDTKVQVEKTADEDMIRFDVAGTEAVRLEKIAGIGGHGRMTFSNTANNILIGKLSGNSLTSGAGNIFLGGLVGQLNTTGFENTFVGHEVGIKNTTGFRNIFLGTQAGYNMTSGASNILIGYQAGYKNGTGTSNISLGFQAGYSSSGTGNIFIGTQAGYYETGSNKLYIENSSSIHPLIYGDFASNIVKIHGTLGIHNTYTFPTVDGAVGQILTTDGAGNLHWSNLGTHSATQNIILNDHWLSNNGHNTGIRISDVGSVGVKIGTPRASLHVGDGSVWIGGTHSGGLGAHAGKGIRMFNTAGKESHIFAFDYTNLQARDLVIQHPGGLTGIARVPITNTLEVNGNASKVTAGSWLANSDARLKKNITPLSSEKMLNDLLALQGVTYEWNDTTTGNDRPTGIQYGFTAQNIQEVFPTLVEEDNLGYLQTAYGTYDAMTVEAIRALNDKIKQLEEENEILKADNEILKAQATKIDKLEAMILELQSK